MPIHLLWGDDEAARGRRVEALITELVDPAWAAINLSRLDGQDSAQAGRALEEARTPPFGGGARLVLLQRSPFCNQCPAELAEPFEATLPLLPPDCHLVLVNAAKPDGRLRTTKALQKLVKAGEAEEQAFQLPAIWDGAGQVELVHRTARELGLQLEPGAAEALSEAIGNDSARLASELEKLQLFGQGEGAQTGAIGVEAVRALVGGHSTSALAVGDALLEGQPVTAIALVDSLLERGEPALRIVAALTSQIRGWLWVALLDQRGERDVAVIAKAAGIGNPKRIYVMRKQIQGRPAGRFLSLLSQLLDVEAALKRGTDPGDAFRDGFLFAGPHGR
jgi:DNA polymerase-3 subunit delta